MRSRRGVGSDAPCARDRHAAARAHGLPAHELRSKSTADPTSGFDKRVGVDKDGVGGTKLEEQDAPKKSEIDATAKLEQSAVYKFKGSHARVVNAGVYTASFDVVSASVAYRF